MKKSIRVGDEVEIVAGEQKGVRGKVLRVAVAENRLVVEGVRMRKKCVKKSERHPDGAILQAESPLHRSNVRKISLEKQ
ncbi:MAG: 50S ribosomal protein L24 [Puniceicoccales bacterium]|nr:50S ribosomal protein L24 [Puniceicoccales bacterium]